MEKTIATAAYPATFKRPGHLRMLAQIIGIPILIPAAGAGVFVATLLAAHWSLVGINNTTGKAIERYTAPANAYVLTAFAQAAGTPVERVPLKTAKRRTAAELEAYEATLTMREQDLADASALYTAAITIHRTCEATAAYRLKHEPICSELATAAAETELKKKVAYKD